MEMKSKITNNLVRRLCKFSAKPFVLLLLFLCGSSKVNCQSVRLFTTDKDLSSSIIHQVYSDSKGIIWIATADGLNRFDGAKFTVFRSAKKDTSSVPHNYVKSIFENSQGHLFFGFFNGLEQYDRATQAFHKIPLLTKDSVDFPAHVTSFVEMPNRDILIGTSGQGIYTLHKNSSRAYKGKFNALIKKNFINLLFKDIHNNIWVATSKSGLFKVSPDSDVKHFLSQDRYKNVDITSITDDKEGNIYVGTLNNGLFKYAPLEDSFIEILYKNNLFPPITSLNFSKNDQLLIGTEGRGLMLLNSKEGCITRSSVNSPSLDFEKTKIHSITTDKSGNLWLGIYQKGLMLIPPKTNNFHYIGFKSLKNNSIGSSAVTSVAKIDNGLTLIGTDGDGLYGITKKGRKEFHFGTKKGFPPTIMSIFQDSNGTIWIGSYLHGMAKINIESGEINYLQNITDENSKQVRHIYSITEDQDKNLWIGSMGSGLFSMSLNTGKITHYSGIKGELYNEQTNYLHNDYINCLYYDDNKLYIGTFDGLGCLDLKTNNFVTTFGKNRILPIRIVNSIYGDNENLWIGTSEGLVRLSRKTLAYNNYTVKDGLPNNMISSVASDKEGNLWLGTFHGISKLNTHNDDITNYYFNDGLHGNEYSRDAVYSNEKNEIAFGGLHGVTYFNPQEIKDKSPPPKVRLTGFYIQNLNVRKGVRSGSFQIVDTSVMDAQKFNLSASDNSFSIEFSTLDYANPEHISYSYSLGKEEWIDLRQGVNTLAFNNLSTGKYLLRVRAKDYNSFSAPKDINIIIHPAWYASQWALLSYLLIFIFLIFLGIRHLRQRHRTKERIREHINRNRIIDAKLKLFTNISHEIKTPISLIINPLKNLIHSDDNEERQRTYGIIKRNSERILHLMNQLMDVSKIDKGQMTLNLQKTNIVKYLRDLCMVFEEQLKSKNLNFTIEGTENETYVDIDPNNFDKVVLNIMSNAIKFTPVNGEIKICIKTVGSTNFEESPICQMTIVDSGIGIEQDHIERIFERFHQIPNQERPQYGGTGIGLHLAKSIVEMHLGEIWAENNENSKGSRFIINLPIQQKSSREKEESSESENSSPDLHIPTNLNISLKKKSDLIKKKSNPQILLVDDDVELLNYLQEELSSKFNLITASNGKTAFSIALKEKPDLILSDIVMPEMDGITFCKKVKQNPNINHIPIILLTAKSTERAYLKSLKMKADAFIQKPFNIDILRKTMESIIENREILRNNYTGSQKYSGKIKEIQLKSSDEKLIQKVLKIVNDNMNNPELNVEDIAHQIGISRVHLYRKLKKLTNQSASDFIKNIRLNQATKLLNSKSLTISEIAFATGFSNVSTFSRNFKNLYGLTPKEYRESIRREEVNM